MIALPGVDTDSAKVGRADARVLVVADEATARYGFPDGHPFSSERQPAFLREFHARGLHRRCTLAPSRQASAAQLAWFHDPDYLQRVQRGSDAGGGWLDAGDTPAFPGCFEAASAVVGATLAAGEAVMSGLADRAFVPIGGLHHARRDSAAGFCIFNDCAVLVEALRRAGLVRIAYVDIDAHHGDGVFYAFEDDPAVIVADLHEDGRFLYPGTGGASETGTGAAAGTKLNIPLPPGADDARFAVEWPRVVAHLARHRPEFILLQCGADSLRGDPITHLGLSAASHARAAADLCRLAVELGHGRVLAMGGGGYNLANLASAWNSVVEALLEA